MIQGLTQGLFGRKHATLAPSLTALGPNTYLSQMDFLKMLGIAFGAHLLVFFIASLFPHEKVTSIPVRALSFKLGDQDRVAAYAPVTAPATVAAPTMSASASTHVSAPVKAAAVPVHTVPQPVKPQKIAPAPAPHPVVPKPIPQPVARPVEQPKPQPQTAPAPAAIAATPQQYVREVGQAAQPLASSPATAGTPQGAIGGAGLETTQTEQTVQAIRDRYEQQISGWIERHKYYPAEAGGREGRVVIRMRIDRAGAVRYYALEQSSGVPSIDSAAIDMIRRANPMPAVPANYPAGSLVEFLIPITFHAPR